MSKIIIRQIKTNIHPYQLYDKIKDHGPGFLLESQLVNPHFGRYSLIGSDPFLIFKSKGRSIEITHHRKVRKITGDPFDVLKNLACQYQQPRGRNFPFPTSGIIGYFGYDLKNHVEKLPSCAKDDLRLPDCYLGFYDGFVVFDHVQQKVFLTAVSIDRKKAQQKFIEQEKWFEASVSDEPTGPLRRKKIKLISNFTKPAYLKAVNKVKAYIAAGDIYQANLSQRFSAKVNLRPYDIYKKLRAINPAPFAAYLNFPEVQVISSSPERFLRISGDNVETRPIKGTRPRGKNKTADQRLARELLNSEKDKAELLMIIDLERNDLGRVCRYHTVHVPELMALEKYATVFHLVSTIRGKLKPGLSHIDCLKACFPGGSITGAPKIRAMEIIEELEPTKRSIYTGATGYIGFNQETDLNIVIRTIIHKNGRVYFQVGGGIVADSEPEKEFEETLVKAKALIKAINGTDK
jgi:para-aminobenzoate synthetase component I